MLRDSNGELYAGIGGSGFVITVESTLKVRSLICGESSEMEYVVRMVYVRVVPTGASVLVYEYPYYYVSPGFKVFVLGMMFVYQVRCATKL